MREEGGGYRGERENPPIPVASPDNLFRNPLRDAGIEPADAEIHFEEGAPVKAKGPLRLDRGVCGSGE